MKRPILLEAYSSVDSSTLETRLPVCGKGKSFSLCVMVSRVVRFCVCVCLTGPASKGGLSHCPLCHDNLPSGEAGWKQHLMSKDGCVQNPRRIPALNATAGLSVSVFCVSVRTCLCLCPAEAAECVVLIGRVIYGHWVSVFLLLGN